MAQLERRQCRLCGRVDDVATLVLVGHTESRPGWCGGPRQGGRPVYVHQGCADEQAQRDLEAAARLEAAKAYLAECRAAGVHADLDRWEELAGY